MKSTLLTAALLFGFSAPAWSAAQGGGSEGPVGYGGVKIQMMPMMGPVPDLAAAATKLGITETQLKDAFNNTLPPDFSAAAKNLGITVAQLKSALGVK